jgi:glyceraldehyde 3-phosphate dehydrogenase
MTSPRIVSLLPSATEILAVLGLGPYQVGRSHECDYPADRCRPYLTGNTKRVIISATSWDAGSTLVYGFNHTSLDLSMDIVSYGSCTVNAYVPLADYIHSQYGLVDSDVNVVHNVPAYKLPDSQTLNRKFCTLEKSAKNLLPYLDDSNFMVNYTLVPYSVFQASEVQ